MTASSSQTATAAGADGLVDQTAFEGLFVRALRLEASNGAFVADLAAVGYDPRAPLAKYPAKVFHDALRVACRHEYPGMPEDKALVELGRRFIDGFFATIVGKLVSTMLPFLS